MMRLLESDGAPERRPGGTMTSMLVHAAIIAGAVVATTRSTPPVRTVDIPPEVVYRAPVPPTESRAASGPERSAGGEASSNELRVPVPTITPVGIPPVTIDVPATAGPDVEVRLGGPARGPAEGGFGGTPSGGYGAPDASGTWDAHTVEVPVVPDARNPSPTYPEMLRTAGMTGRVVTEFIVDSTGRVRPGSLTIIETTHELFAASVRRAVPSFRFTPARVRGRKVAQRVRVPFEFEMEGR